MIKSITLRYITGADIDNLYITTL